MGGWADWHREMGGRWPPRGKGWDSRSCSNRICAIKTPLWEGEPWSGEQVTPRRRRLLAASLPPAFLPKARLATIWWLL